MCGFQNKVTRHKKKCGPTQKNPNKSLETYPKEMEIHELPDKNFRTIMEMHGELRKMVYETMRMRM